MSTADPSLSLAQRIDAVCDRFESDWRTGRRQAVDAYIADLPDAEREEVRTALLAVQKELETHSRSVDSSASQDSEPTGVYRLEASQPTRIGRFEILALLGEGAFGRVYKACDPQLEREVAIKVPRVEAYGGQFDLQRFLREAKSAAAVQHPNICPVHEVNVEGGQPYIVMAFIQGQSLAEILKGRSKPLPPKQAALIVRKLALALQAAHEKGIVHRDLKPANILFDPQRKDVVITDFGLAVRTTSDVRQTHSGMLMGTPAYMSPEQARGDVKQVGPASDIFALGVILYELLTGQRPFQGGLGDVIGQIQHVDPPSIRTHNPQLDDRLDAICQQALAKNPGDRFPSMQALAAALDAYLRDQPQATAMSQKAKEVDPGHSVGFVQVITALSADLRAGTEAAVEAAMRRVRPPVKLLVILGLLFFSSFATLAVLLFFTRTPTATVLINIDVDLNDETLSFFLDGEQASAESLQSPIELKVGTHELVVKRGEEIIRKFTFTVSRDAGPRIELREETPNKQPTPPGPVWTPLIQSAEDLVEGTTISKNDASRSVVLQDGKLEMRGNGAFFRPPFIGRNYVVRARIHEFEGQNVLFRVRLQTNGGAGYGGFFHWGDRNLDWPTCGIGQVPVGGTWEDKAISLKQVSDTLPVEFAVAVYGNTVIVYMNGEQMTAWSDGEFAEGATAFRLTGDGRVVLSDLAVCALDGTSFTPADVLPQVEDPEIRRRLSPEYLTQELQTTNLLKNGDFEVGDTNGWKFESWRNNKSSVAVVEDIVHTGRKALRIRANQNDSIELKQTVKVSPNRWYLLSGWIKTQNLKFWERDHQGAHLYVWGHHRHQSKSLPANADWTYFAVIFDSGRRQSVDVAARLGAFAGTMTGTAWFDDLCLVELPPLSKDQPNNPDSDRAAAIKVLQLRGIVTVQVGDREIVVNGRDQHEPFDQLPQEPFQITQIDLRNDRRRVLPTDSLEPLAGLKNLKRLTLEGAEVGGNGIRPLAGLTTLEFLVLDSCRLNDADLVHLKDLAKLTELSLSWNQLTGTGFVHLKGLTKLKLLSLYATQTTDDNLAHLYDLPELERLVVHQCQVTGKTFPNFKTWPRWKSVYLRGGPPSSRDLLPHLKTNQALEELALNMAWTDDDLAHLAMNKALQVLEIDQGAAITDRGLAFLSGLTNMRTVLLKDSQITDEGLDHLLGWKSLGMIHLPPKITHRGVAKLRALPNLRVLGWRSATDEGMVYMKDFPNMKELWLNNSQITDEGLKHLHGLPKLGEIGLRNTAVTTAAIQSLKDSYHGRPFHVFLGDDKPIQ